MTTISHERVEPNANTPIANTPMTASNNPGNSFTNPTTAKTMALMIAAWLNTALA
jgi:hypothetical protein